MIKAILMDFNGIIINDERIQMQAYQEILKKEDIELTEDDYFSSLGMNHETFINKIYDRACKTLEGNKSMEISTAKTNRWRDLVTEELPIFEGVENFVHKMSQEFALGIVSMSKREEIVYVLERANLARYFSAIISAEDVTECKPNPQCYRAGFRTLDAWRTSHKHLPMTHEDCVVIEDSPAGVRAAKAADLYALGVTNTVSAEQLREAGADSVTKNLNDWMPATFRQVFA